MTRRLHFRDLSAMAERWWKQSRYREIQIVRRSFWATGVPPKCRLAERRRKAGRGPWIVFPDLFRLAERSRTCNRRPGAGPVCSHRYSSVKFPPGGTNPEKAFRPLDRRSAFFPAGGTLAELRWPKTISAQSGSPGIEIFSAVFPPGGTNPEKVFRRCVRCAKF